MKRLFRGLGTFIENKRLLVIIVSLALVVPMIFGAMQLQMESGTETFVSTNSQVYKDFDRFNQHFSSDVIAVLVTGDDMTQLLQPDNVRAMESVEDQMGANPNVISAVGPTFLMKQAVAHQAETSALPDDPQELLGIVTDSQTGAIREEFRQVFPDTEHALIAVVMKGGMSPDQSKDVIDATETAAADAGFTDVELIITGQPVLLEQLQESIASGMSSMLIVAVVLMLVILVLIFSVRGFFTWRWLPLGVVLIAIIYAFGAMGVLSIPMTMVTMSAFPVLIGLGVDYAIQFHNRYDEEARRGETVAEAIIESVTHIGPAIGIAIVAACLGFTALFFSPVPMIKDFGATLIIGVVACYLLAMFLLLAVLYWHDHRKNNKPKATPKKTELKRGREGRGFVERALHRLAPRVIKSPAIILPIALLLCVVGVIADDHVGTETDVMEFLSSDLSVVQNLGTLEAVTGGRTSANLLVEAEDISDPEILTWIMQLEHRIGEEQSEIVSSTSSIVGLILQSNGGAIPQDPQEAEQILGTLPAPIKRNLITNDHSAANVVLSVGQLGGDQIKDLKADLTDYTADAPPGVNVAVTGPPVIQDKVIDGLTEGRVEMTLIGVAFVFGGLFFLFRFRTLRALMAILPIALIIGWSGGLMYLMGIKYTPVTATLGALIIGIGVEFTILLMTRYYEERGKGEGPEEAMATAVTKIGRAIIASGLTVVGGFGALLIAKDFPILQDFGIVTMINVLFALVSTLFVLPPLIVLVDRWHERRQARRPT